MEKFKSLIEAFEKPTDENEEVVMEQEQTEDEQNRVNNYTNGINSMIQDTWGLIGNLQGFIAMIKADNDVVNNKEKINSELEDALDQTIVVLGLLTKALNTTNPKLTAAIDDVIENN